MLSEVARSRRIFPGPLFSSLAAHVAAIALVLLFGGRVAGPTLHRSAITLVEPLIRHAEPRRVLPPPDSPKRHFLAPRLETLVRIAPEAPVIAPPVSVLHPDERLNLAPPLPAPPGLHPPAPIAARETGAFAIPPATAALPQPVRTTHAAGFESTAAAHDGHTTNPRVTQNSGFAGVTGSPAGPHPKTEEPAPSVAPAGFGSTATVRNGSATGARVTQNSGFGGVPLVSASSARPGTATPGGFFGDASVAAPSAPQVKTEESAPLTPVEILVKPRPAYTPEARNLHIEGDVVVSVLFTASGEVRILGVRQGLGHGLDEAAIAAASAIRFRPAQRDGRPVDATATVHIRFQLAY